MFWKRTVCLVFVWIYILCYVLNKYRMYGIFWGYYNTPVCMCGDYVAGCPISVALHHIYACSNYFSLNFQHLCQCRLLVPKCLDTSTHTFSYLTFLKHILLWTYLVHSCPCFGVPLKTCSSCLCSPRYCICYIHEDFNKLLQVLKKDAVVSHENCDCTCSFCKYSW